MRTKVTANVSKTWIDHLVSIRHRKTTLFVHNKKYTGASTGIFSASLPPNLPQMTVDPNLAFHEWNIQYSTPVKILKNLKRILPFCLKLTSSFEIGLYKAEAKVDLSTNLYGRESSVWALWPGSVETARSNLTNGTLVVRGGYEVQS